MRQVDFLVGGMAISNRGGRWRSETPVAMLTHPTSRHRESVNHMKPLQFFATSADIQSVLNAAERDEPLQCVRTGNQLSQTFETFRSGKDIPGLGIADHETGTACSSFLVTFTTVPVVVRTLRGTDNAQRFLMDQLANPDTVTLTPAGTWGKNTILQGVVGTTYESVITRDLMRKFVAAFRTLFRKVQGRSVGPQALAQLRAGARLTIAQQIPREFDLTLEPESGSA